MESFETKKHYRSKAVAAYKDFSIYVEDEQFLRKTEESTQISRDSFSSEEGEVMLLERVVENIRLEQEIEKCFREEGLRAVRNRVLAEFFAQTSGVEDLKISIKKESKKKIKKMVKCFKAPGKLSLKGLNCSMKIASEVNSCLLSNRSAKQPKTRDY